MTARRKSGYTENMKDKTEQYHPIGTGCIRGGITCRNPDLPESNNTALHVCVDPCKVMENRKALAQKTVGLERWVIPGQKHTGHVQRVTAADAGKGAFDHDSAIAMTDGLYTTEPNLLIGVMTADCLGIVFMDETIPMAAVVHSGWRGTAQAITLEMINALKKDGLFHPESLQVFFAPSLMMDSLEVGPEVIEQISDMAHKHHLNTDGCIRKGKGDRYYMDNQEINVRMLTANGISEKNIHRSGTDTKTSEDCFSYRRDGKQCGEHFSFVWIDQKQD